MAFEMKNSQDISRVLRTKEEARQSYDKMSRWYDLFTSSEKKFTELGLATLDIQPNETILEIGFGTGHALLTLVREENTIYGIDLSLKMCTHAHSKLQRANLDKHIHLQNGDATHLPYPNEVFDAVFISFTLELFDTPEIPLVLHEIKRTLKKGGRTVVVSLLKTPRQSVRIYEWFHQKMPMLIDCRPIRAQESLESADFQTMENITKTMWRLPVSIISAKK